MEMKFYQEDELANFLNEATADFKMYPQRRVWHSLYNNLHPGRKWPSLAVAVFLISSILYLGVSNNNSINKNARLVKNSLPENNITNNSTSANNITSATLNKSVNSLAIRALSAPITAAETNPAVITLKELAETSNMTVSSTKNIDQFPAATLTTSTNTSGNIERNKVTAPVATKGKLTAEAEVEASTLSNSSSVANNNPSIVTNLSNLDSKKTEENSNVSISKNNNATVKINKETKAENKELKSWLDDYAFYNKPKDRSIKARGSILYYVTTSVGFRTLKEKNSPFPTTAPVVVPGPVAQVVSSRNINGVDNRVAQGYAINLEAGAKMMYKINGNLNLAAGLQFNYTNYIISATKLDHSIQTDIFMIDKTGNHKEARASNYANAIRNNFSTLNNSTTQLSIPIGIDYKIAGGNKLNWFAGASVQPGITLGGNAYALSSNKEFYINEPSALRRTNINTSIETYLSYKTGAGISVIAGPQVRYQLLSTYKDRYNYTEKLYNMGIKIGLKKNL